MNGTLIVRVYADSVGQPVKGAKVHLTGNGIDRIFTTNDLGETQSISLPAPDISISLDRESNELAYSPYEISVTNFDLEEKTVTGLEIFPTITTYQDVYMFRQKESTNILSNITIPQHYVNSYEPKIPEQDTSDISTLILKEVVIPEYVIVHDGLLTNTGAPNYWVQFAEYIKNVASSEIYPTWPTETLKANICAIISFTLNRFYTEWYPSQGYDFTITSSTAYDHKFIYGRPIFDTISNIVDKIFNQYIVIEPNRHPFLAQYVDGKIVAERPNWLSQWGAEYLGRIGYTALQILKYYYTNAASLRIATQVEGLPSSYPGYPLSEGGGSCGEDVQQIQKQLNVIRNNYPAIPLITSPNGNFNSNTTAAVKTFQSVFKLPQTGIVDNATWYKISYIYAAVSGLS
ncbi:MAG: peptidoglycan-binding protein [Oscillospiraceae bacterium]|jgi:hypothetical protein|nr:peptidoglycan-binding protein [Oscillospiraceae bacterium]